VIATLETAIRSTVSSAEFVKAAENVGVRPAFASADEFSALIQKEDTELSRLMQTIGLKKQPSS
jgi:tripartite-type tricarboxylate transporter receptor subunit TctC